MSDTGFKVVLDNAELRDAVAPAIRAAKRASETGLDNCGVVIGQFYILDDGRVEIRGNFIEHEAALPIYTALRKRVAPSEQ
jgi:hypothetical protein